MLSFEIRVRFKVRVRFVDVEGLDIFCLVRFRVNVDSRLGWIRIY